jgi:serine/threonine protein kinase
MEIKWPSKWSVWPQIMELNLLLMRYDDTSLQIKNHPLCQLHWSGWNQHSIITIHEDQTKAHSQLHGKWLQITVSKLFICVYSLLIHILQFLIMGGVCQVISLSRVRHQNLVRLLGFCYESKKQLLVYEFMPGGTLMDRLYGNVSVIFSSSIPCGELQHSCLWVWLNRFNCNV